jgi:hypothetical protein
MKKVLVSVAVLAAVIVLTAGCTTTRLADAKSVNPEQTSPALGVVRLSGMGNPPAEAALRIDLRQRAAREFNIPVDEVVLGPLDFSGVGSAGWEADRLSDGSHAPVRPVEATSWAARAEVRRKNAPAS